MAPTQSRSFSTGAVTRFVGRGPELGRLRAALDDARAGTGAVVMLCGDPGIGKTRLAEELAAEAPRTGVCVLWGRCHEGEGTPAFWPWVQVLRAYVRNHPPAALRAELGAGAADIAQIVDDVRRLFPDLPQPSPLEPAQARFRLFDSIALFLANAARAQPLLVILDDLHWADTPSLLLLSFLARQMRDARLPSRGAITGSPGLLILGAYREGEVGRGHPLAQTLAELAREHAATRIALAGLAERETALFIESIIGAPPPAAVTAAVHEETEGSPLFMIEVVRLLAADGSLTRSHSAAVHGVAIPASVRDVIGLRLDRLSETCHRVLAVAAVLGREFSLAALERVRDWGTELLDALEEAEGARVIAAVPDVPGRYRFSHALIRETVYEELPTTRRVRLHRQAAEALERQYAADPEPHLVELVHHFALAAPGGDVDRAISYAWRAAGHAVARFAYEEAARHYETALRVLSLKEPPDERRRCAVLLDLGDALLPAGETRRVVDEIAPEALNIAEALEDRPSAVRACRMALAGLARYGSATVAGTPLYRQWAERSSRFAAPGTAGRVHADLTLAAVHSSEGRFAEARTLRTGALQLARALGDPEATVRAAFELFGWPGAPHFQAERRRLAAEFADHSADGVHPWTLGQVLWRSGDVLLDHGERAQAEAVWRRLADLAARMRASDIHLLSSVTDAIQAMLDGRLEDGADACARLVVQADSLGMPVYGRQLAAMAAPRILLYLGRGEEALAASTQARRLAGLEETHIVGHAGFFAARRALCLAHLGRAEQAGDLLGRFLREGDIDTSPTETSVLVLTLLLETAVLLEERGAAMALARHLEDVAFLATANNAFTCLARHLGAASSLLGDRQAARTWYEQALAVAGAVRFRPEIALTRLALAELVLGGPLPQPLPRSAGEGSYREQGFSPSPALRGRGSGGGGPTEALAELDIAIAEFHAMRMRPALARAESLRRAAVGGANVPPPDAPTTPAHTALPAGLTRREVEVLQLVAAGRTSQEIAEVLVVSIHTVTRHIANIYAKIGAHGRADATAYAVRHGLIARGPGVSSR